MVRRKKRTVTSYINGRPWKISFEGKTHKDLDGDCWWQKKLIRVFKNSEGKYEPETVVHELLHAVFPDMPEDDVMQAGKDLTNALCECDIHFTKGLVRGNKEF